MMGNNIETFVCWILLTQVNNEFVWSEHVITVIIFASSGMNWSIFNDEIVCGWPDA